MREGLINVPKFDNDGNSLDHVVTDAVESLATLFGGVTVVEAMGSWFHEGKLYREPIMQIMTAYTPSKENDKLLRTVAATIGVKAKQIAMYVRLASGEVEIIGIQAKSKRAA